MDDLAAPQSSSWRPWQHWVVDVLRTWKWRHTGVVLTLDLLSQIWSGNLVVAVQNTESHLLLWMSYHALQLAFPLVLAVRLADRAIDDGANRIVTYGVSITLALCFANWPGYKIVSLLSGDTGIWQFSDNVSLIAWWLFLSFLGVAAYSNWHQEQMAIRRLRAGEIGRARQQQEMQAARLLALQARVEPALLFDTLQRIDALIGSSPSQADALLTDMIDMLRAMLPVPGASASTVDREFALVRAYARVTGIEALQPSRLVLDVTPSAQAANLAPLVLIPILRALTIASPSSWRVRARRDEDQLHLTITPESCLHEADWMALRSFNPVTLCERLVTVHGNTAIVRVATEELPGIYIEVPYQNDESTDR